MKCKHCPAESESPRTGLCKPCWDNERRSKKRVSHSRKMQCSLYKERRRLKSAKWRNANLQKSRQVSREAHARLHKEAISRYGGKCSCCSESRLEFLVIDHVNGGGNEERRKLGTSRLARRIAKSDVDLSKYRVLCHNCNMAIGFYGYCPHERERECAVQNVVQLSL